MYTVVVEAEDVSYMEEDVSGTYTLLPHCNSAENSMYVRTPPAATTAATTAAVLPPMYMFVDPEKCGASSEDSVVRAVSFFFRFCCFFRPMYRPIG